MNLDAFPGGADECRKFLFEWAEEVARTVCPSTTTERSRDKVLAVIRLAEERLKETATATQFALIVQGTCDRFWVDVSLDGWLAADEPESVGVKLTRISEPSEPSGVVKVFDSRKSAIAFYARHFPNLDYEVVPIQEIREMKSVGWKRVT